MARGFAGMPAERLREVAVKGGKAAHQKGTAHEFTSEEARAAGRKGGAGRHKGRATMGGNVPAQESPRDRHPLADIDW